MIPTVEPVPRMSTADKADADLVAELLQPGSDALAELIKRYVRLVHRVAAGILQDDTEAEDVTQEVFLEIYRKAHLYDPARGTVRVWLLQYAYRRSFRRKNLLRRRAAYNGEPLQGLDLAPRGRPPELTPQECRWFIRRGLAELTEPQRATVERACFQDATLREIATDLHVSVGCARHYYYRGLARLRAWANGAGTKRKVPKVARRRADLSAQRAPDHRGWSDVVPVHGAVCGRTDIE
jgi:RNA polymerase sigma-70 factor, ECF subfamily